MKTSSFAFLARVAAAAVALFFLPCPAADAPPEALKALFNEGLSAAELEQAAANALKAGVPPQIVSEAKLVWGLRHQDHAFLEKTLPELEAAAKDFKKENSAGLSSPDDLHALINYIRALAAMKKGDLEGFKKHITEAFWLSPEQARLFAQAITSHRNQEKMANVNVDLKRPLTTSQGGKTTLAEQLGSNKALLLDFWASWCGPCMNLMPKLRKVADHLKSHGVVVCGVNTESDEAVAEKVRAEKDMKLPWLVEPKDRPFSDPLEINSIPRTVLISPAGKILYNGHPEDPALWAALKGVDPSIAEPKEP